MNELKISPNFTIEDMHRIREHNEERRITIGEEAFWDEVHADSLCMQEKIKEIREKRLAQNAAGISKAI
ncbi:hypothetical protein FACS1894204_13810 [Synergistales bacterium]|nr:hypothetical protein FACS1894204_13810 [Synergistales bacterium]